MFKILEIKAKINKIIKFSNVDGPGNRMSIFFQGCNYNCVYCHNPETINICKNCQKCISKCPVEALEISNSHVKWNNKKCIECDACTDSCPSSSSPKITEYTVGELLEEIKKVKGFIRGITVSGGEATLNYKFITKLFREVKRLGLTTFVDTNGSLDLSCEKYREFVEVTDKFMLDIKVWDNKKHLDYIDSINKKNNEIVKKNIKFLGNINKKNQVKLFEVRTVILPEIFDNIETVELVTQLIGKINKKHLENNILEDEITYKLIKYRKIGVNKINLDEKLNNINSPSDKMMEELKNIAIKNNVKNIVLI